MRRQLLLASSAVVLGFIAYVRNQSPDGSSILDDAQDTYEDAVSAVAGWSLPSRAAPYAAIIAQTEQDQGIPTNMLARLLYQESRYRDDIITGATRSSTGALGIAQFMPDTAQSLGIDPLDPNQAIPAAGRYLRSLYDQTGDWSLALAAYNWGIGNVKRKVINAGTTLDQVAPQETIDYVAQITGDIGYA